jgi:flagellar biogenesis protein FliO
MRAGLISLCSLCSLLTASEAAALGPISFSKGIIRLEGGAEDAANRTLWTRGNSLVLAFPGNVSAEPQSIKLKDPLLKEVRLTARGNRTELELRLHERGERVLGRVRLETRKNDLLISIASPTGTAESPPAAPVAEERPSPATRPDRARPTLPDGDRPAAPIAAPVAPTGAKGWPPPAAAKNPLAALAGGKEPAGGRGSLWMLALCAVGAGVGVWVLRRRRKNPNVEDAHIDVVTSRSLGAKQRLVLIETAGELLLLGCTEKEIRLIRALDRRGLQKLQQSSEETFFEEGAQIDAENAAASADPEPGEPRREPARAPEPIPREGFIARLSQQIQARAVEKQRQPEPVQPLDEDWARGILKLRRAARARNTPPSNETLH